MTHGKPRRREDVEPSVWRFTLVMAVAVLAVVVLLLRAVDLQVVNRDFLLNQADARHLRTVVVPAHRGMITDREGEALAISSPVDSVWADPGDLLAAPEGVRQLAALLDRPAPQLAEFLRARADRQFVYLRRHASPDLVERVTAAAIPGVHLQREYRRFYPAGEVAAQLIGTTDIDDVGLEGIERVLDQRLRGRPGSKRVLRDRLGRIVEDVELLREPRPGETLTLSVDRRLQYLAYRELKGAVSRHGAQSGAAVLLDVKTGEILAMVNQPSFNPHRRSDVSHAQRRNRAVADVYEPGSVIKPFTVAAALAGGVARPETVLETGPGMMRVGRHTIRDLANYGALDLTGVIQKSSNVGAAKLALRTPPRVLWDTFMDFGFGAVTGSGLPGEASGVLSPAPPRGEVERATLAYGYGLSTTPLQLARAYAAIASGGLMRDISMLRRDDPANEYRILEAGVAAELARMMERVVEPAGTGMNAAVPGYRVAGKTGTVRKSGPGGYIEDEYVAMFVGFAPASNPRLALAVVIDRPSGEAYYGGQVAAPVFSRVMAGALRLLNVPPDDLPEPNRPVLAGGRE